MVVVAAVAVSLRWRNADADSPFGTDEADYVRAMAYGPAAAYFGTHERSGLSLLRDVVADSSDRDDLRELRRKVAAGEIDAIVQVGSIPEAQGFVESMPHPSAVSGDVFAGPAHLTWWELR
jgi:hypothetical protein